MKPSPYRLPITATLIARNEAENLRRALLSVVDWVSEIVVVINDCTDETESVARSFGARVFEHPWQGFRDQKNYALDQATQPWVLGLDADEEVSPELRESLHRFFQEDAEKFDGAEFARKVWLIDRWITHGDWYPDRKLRLFRRERGRFGGSLEHDRVVLDGRSRRIAGDLHHYSQPELRMGIAKINPFADYFVQRQVEAGRSWSSLQTVVRPWWRFVRGYILRRGFLDGFPGFYIAVFCAFGAFVRYSRVYEQQFQKLPPVQESQGTAQPPQMQQSTMETSPVRSGWAASVQ